MADPEDEADTEIVAVEPPERKPAGRLGALLRARRVALGMHQNDLALATGVGRRFIIDLEAGKPSCQVGKALLVAEALGLHILDNLEARDAHPPGEPTIHSTGIASTAMMGQPGVTTSSTAGHRADDLDLPDDIEEPGSEESTR